MGAKPSSTATDLSVGEALEAAKALSVGEALEAARALMESPTVGPSLLGTLRQYSRDEHRDLLVDESDMKRLRRNVAAECPELSRESTWRVAWALVPLIYARMQEENLGSYPAGFQMSHDRLLDFFFLGKIGIHVLCESFRNSNAVLKRMKLTVDCSKEELGGEELPTWAASLGSLVGANSTIEELSLQIWFKHYTFESAGTLVSFFGTMQANRSLRSLTVVENCHIWKIPVASRAIGMGRVFKILGYMLQHNSVLTTLRINCGIHLEQGSIKALADGLLNNTRLEVLHLGLGEVMLNSFDQGFTAPIIQREAATEPIILSEADAASLGDMLAASAALQDLQIEAPFTCDQKLVAGLSQNSTLNRLSVRLDKVGAEAALDLLTRGGAPNLKSLTLYYCDADVKVLTAMITSNRTLLGLGLPNAAYSTQEWAEAIVPAFVNNRVIRELNLQYCSRVDDSKVYNAMLDLLNSNITLETIDLYGTPLQHDAKAESVQEELRRNKAYGAALRVLPTMRPKSCRLILCGYDFAGKTTLRDTMLAIALQQAAASASTSTDERLEYVGEQDPEKPRTRGFEVCTLLDESDLRVNMWDFAGHQEYYALHDCVFPSVNDSSIFMFAYNPVRYSHDNRVIGPKTHAGFTSELDYWLRFMASNSKVRSSQPTKPFVIVVITHQDRQECKVNRTQMNQLIRDLKFKFKDVVEVHGESFLINALRGSDVEPILRSVTAKFRNMLESATPVPIICEQTRVALKEWSSANGGSPIIPVKEFREVYERACRDGLNADVFDKLGERGWKVVAAYLHDTGDIMYFDGLDFIVVNPHWFGHGVLGYLVNLNFIAALEPSSVPKFRPKNGIVDELALQDLLNQSMAHMGLDTTKIMLQDLIDLMLRLDLCFLKGKRTDGGVTYRIFYIPFLFEDTNNMAANGDRQMEWPAGQRDLRCTFVGRRLQCADTDCTYLTPGFFPRLQVELLEYCAENNWINLEEHYGKDLVDTNLFHISVAGHDILLEYSGHVGYFVDIMARSITNHLETLDFLQKTFITQIRRFCASQRGCKGVSLVEGVIRKDCVERLTLCKYRKHGAKLLAEVKAKILQEPNKFLHILHWQPIMNEHKDKPDTLGHKTEYAARLDNDIIIVGDMHDIPGATSELNPATTGDSSSARVHMPQGFGPSYANTSVESGRRRGVAVILSIEGGRPGAQVDRGRLDYFTRQMAFEPVYFVDSGDAYALRNQFREIAQDSCLLKDDGFLCCINAHGGITRDGNHYAQLGGDKKEKFFVLKDILEPFTRSRYLANKPKVFLINACRGTGTRTPGIEEEEEGDEDRFYVTKQGDRVPEFLHAVSDCMVVFSTSHGDRSIRDPVRGSFFVEALADVFTRAPSTADVQSIMTSVVGMVTEMEGRQHGESGTLVRQCPVMQQTFTKKLYWHRPAM